MKTVPLGFLFLFSYLWFFFFFLLFESVSHPCCCLATKSCSTLCNPMDCSPPGSSLHGIFPGENTGVGCCFHLQRIFLTQGWKPRLLYCEGILLDCVTWEAPSHPSSNSSFMETIVIKSLPNFGSYVIKYFCTCVSHVLSYFLLTVI